MIGLRHLADTDPAHPLTTESWSPLTTRGFVKQPLIPFPRQAASSTGRNQIRHEDDAARYRGRIAIPCGSARSTPPPFMFEIRNTASRSTFIPPAPARITPRPAVLPVALLTAGLLPSGWFGPRNVT